MIEKQTGGEIIIKGRTVEEIVSKLRPIDDIFFVKLAECEGFCEEILQVILNKKDLKVGKISPQKNLRNIKGKSVILDVLCVDSENVYYNVEVQKSDNDNHQKRVRYNGSNIDTYITEKGTEYKELPNVYVIYISEFDVFKKEKAIYHVKRVIEETGDTVYNGYNEIYVNTKVDDKSDIAELMKIFKSSEIPQNRKFPNVCETIKEFKEEKRSGSMCKLVEEYAKEYAKGERLEGKMEGKIEGKIEGEEGLMYVILELKKGICEEELIRRGFEESTINNAKIVLS